MLKYILVRRIIAMESSPSDMQLFGDDVLEHQYLDTSSSKPPKLDPISIEPSEPTGLSKTEQVFGASLELSGFGVSTGAQEDLVGKGEVSSQSPHDVVSYNPRIFRVRVKMIIDNGIA